MELIDLHSNQHLREQHLNHDIESYHDFASICYLFSVIETWFHDGQYFWLYFMREIFQSNEIQQKYRTSLTDEIQNQLTELFKANSGKSLTDSCKI